MLWDHKALLNIFSIKCVFTRPFPLSLISFDQTWGMRRAIISKWAHLLAEAFPVSSREILSGIWPRQASVGRHWWHRGVLVECLRAEMLIFPPPAVNGDHKRCNESECGLKSEAQALSDGAHSFTSQSAAQNVMFISFLADLLPLHICS